MHRNCGAHQGTANELARLKIESVLARRDITALDAKITKAANDLIENRRIFAEEMAGITERFLARVDLIAAELKITTLRKPKRNGGNGRCV